MFDDVLDTSRLPPPPPASWGVFGVEKHNNDNDDDHVAATQIDYDDNSQAPAEDNLEALTVEPDNELLKSPTPLGRWAREFDEPSPPYYEGSLFQATASLVAAEVSKQHKRMLQNDGPVQLNWPFSLGRTPERKRGQAMGSGSVEQANSMLSIERGDAIPSARGSVEQANSMLSVERGEATPPARDMLTTVTA